MRISVIGTGYVGSVSAACFADIGHIAICVDVDKNKVDMINEGKSPIWEEGLEDLLKKYVPNKISATSNYDDAVKKSDISFICVGTPSDDKGNIDLSIIRAAASSLGKAIAKKDDYHVVVVKSTVVPQTTENIVLPLLEKYSDKRAGKDFGVAMNPEFLREGKAVYDFMHPDKIVVGAIDDKSYSVVAKLYDGMNCEVSKTNPNTAEMIKYVNNAFLATKITFANEMGNICKMLEIDTYKVMHEVGKDSRIGPYFLNAGAGFGGSCFPKDVHALIAKAQHIGYDPRLLNAIIAINDEQPLRIIRLLRQKIGKLNGKTIAILGLAFKNDTDDIRESRAISVIAELLQQRVYIKAYDPMAITNMKKIYPHINYCNDAATALKNANACLLMTEWSEFQNLDKEFTYMKNPVVIDGRHLIDPAKLSTPIDYDGLCW